MKVIAKFVFVSFVLLFNLFSLDAQNVKLGLPEVEFYDRDIYGGGSQNWKIVQSSSGLLYFANHYGLLSFDGSRWAVNKSESFVGLKSLAFIKDELYAGSYNDFGCLKPNSFHQLIYRSFLGPKKLRDFGDFWSIVEYKDQIVFFTEKAICFVKDEELIKVLSPKSRFLGVFSLDKRLFVHDKVEGLFEYVDGTLERTTGGNLLINKAIGAIIPLSKAEFIIATVSDGFYISDFSGIHRWNVDANSLVASVGVNCGAVFQNDYIVLGTLQHGVIVIDKHGNVITHIDKEKGLRNNTVLSILVDREDNIWCGLDNGIAKIKLNSNLTFINDYFNLGTGYVLDRFKGNYYIGTNQGLYKISEQKFKDPLKGRNDFERIYGAQGQPWAFYHDEETLLCGHNLGVLNIDGKDAKVITPISVNGAWSFKPLRNNSSRLLVGTYDGLILLEKKGKDWCFKSKIEGFNKSARFIEWENDSTLFISHSFDGVFRLRCNRDFSKVAVVDSLVFADFPGNRYDLTNAFVDGKCLFSSKAGIYFLSEGSKVPVRYTRFDSFFQNDQFPSTLKEDGFGNIWFFSTLEIGVLRKFEDGSFIKVTYPFLPLEGKMVDYFQTCFTIDDDNVFFNTNSGFAHYLSADRKNFQQPFNVHITSFSSVNDSIVYSLFEDDKGIFLQEFVPEFSFQNNSFDVEFAATFFNDRKMQYSTFLNGVDEKQSNWSRNSNRFFSGLAEGEYELTVYAKNSFEIQANPIRFKFVVNPPWYRSFVAKGFYLLFLVVFFYFIFTYFKQFINKVRNRTTLENQKAFQKKEETLLNEALLKEKEIISIRNEKLLSEASLKEGELANLAVHIVKKNDFLSEIKEQLRRIAVIKDSNEYARKIYNLISKIDQDIDNEGSWAEFNNHLSQVHSTFIAKLTQKHPSLSRREQIICTYIKMGMNSKDISSLMNVSTRTIENNRSKLRQSLDLDSNENLSEYIMSL